jgi:phenylacetic acid degradation operon negative regulatory protein
MDPSPKSLILDLLSTLGRASAPVRSLVSAGNLFGIAENSLRVALARLLAEGLIERDARGSYRIGAGAAAMNREIRGWRDVERRLLPWSGAWVGLHLAGGERLSTRIRHQRQRALRVLGFRRLSPGLELRPDNLAGGVEAIRDRLTSLDLANAGPVFRIESLDENWEQIARDLWESEALVEGYRSTQRQLEESAARLRELPRAAAMAESFRLGGAAIRRVVLDPLLPEPIVPCAERRRLVTAMRRYDRLGREIWKDWLGDEKPHDLPVGVRGPGAGAAALAAVEGS